MCSIALTPPHVALHGMCGFTPACPAGNEAFYRQPYHQLRHPMVFYYVHPAVLYVNKFRVAGLLDDGIDQFIEQVRTSGS
jgi:hypothetical protein